jgi:hypothetical protein
MSLAISAGNGNPTSQANTQTPQSSAAPATNATPSGSVQPGTATSLLTSKGGVQLTNQVLPTISLGTTLTGTEQSAPAQVAQPKHHANVFLLGVAAVLFVMAIAFFWSTARSAKNTT